MRLRVSLRRNLSIYTFIVPSCRRRSPDAGLRSWISFRTLEIRARDRAFAPAWASRSSDVPDSLVHCSFTVKRNAIAGSQAAVRGSATTKVKANCHSAMFFSRHNLS